MNGSKSVSQKIHPFCKRKLPTNDLNIVSIPPKKVNLSENKERRVFSKEVFDTLSDVSTDESDDIQITNIVTPTGKQLPTVKTSHNKVSVSVNKKTVPKKNGGDSKRKDLPESIDYLNQPPNYCLQRLKDFADISVVEIDTGDTSISDSLSSVNTDDQSVVEKVLLENGECFLIDKGPIPEENDDREPKKMRKKRKPKSQRRFPNNPELQTEKDMFKYWKQRYDLFLHFDKGIKLDKESWYSVTPEYIAKQQADLINESDVVLDGFCGAGGNTIQFALKCKKVVAIDIDPVKLELTKHNCRIYNVDPSKLFVINDSFHSFASRYDPIHKDNPSVELQKFDVVFLAPPWGGQNYMVMDSGECQTDFDFTQIKIEDLFAAVRKFNCKTIMLFLPRHSDCNKLQSYLLPNETMTVIKHRTQFNAVENKKIKAVTVVIR